MGRTVEGFRFFAEGVAHIDLSKIPLAEQERIQANAERIKKENLCSNKIARSSIYYMIEIIRNWKKKRQDRKQAKHEKLLVELAEMVDKRRAELLQREREG